MFKYVNEFVDDDVDDFEDGDEEEEDEEFLAKDGDEDEDDGEESEHDANLSNFEFFKRPTGKRKIGDGANAPRRFNMIARCSLKEVALCVKFLKPRHLEMLEDGDHLHLKYFKIKSNINRHLAAFLMYRIDPATMILDLGDGSKVLQIIANVIWKLC